MADAEMITERKGNRGTPHIDATPDAAPVEERAPGTTAARVIHDFWWRHRGGLAHTSYIAGAVVLGDEAAELLASGTPHVVALGDEATFQLCGGIDCRAQVPVAVIRAGELVCADAHVAVTPLRGMIDVSFVTVRPGEVVELLYEPDTARRLIAGAPPGSVRRSGLGIYRAACPVCTASGLYALPR